MNFQPSSYGPTYLGNPSSNPLLPIISGMQVRNSVQLAQLVSHTINSIKLESGKNISNLMRYSTSAQQARTIPEQAKLFGTIRQKAIDYSAPQTAAAIRSAATWFYHNVENPRSSTSVRVSSSAPVVAPPSPVKKKLPLIMLGVSALFLGGVVYWTKFRN
tara:strand:- start:57 stop:536 length:480 start_codon:yes stop_codon:yes gene_type:complete